MSCCRDIVGCPFPLELKDSNADDARGGGVVSIYFIKYRER